MTPEGRQRREDQSFWWRTTTALEKYKVLVWAAIIALIAFGFDFQTPAQALKKVGLRIDGTEGKIAKIQQNQTDLAIELRAITRLQCFNKNYKPEELELAGVDCSFKRRRESGNP